MHKYFYPFDYIVKQSKTVIFLSLYDVKMHKIEGFFQLVIKKLFNTMKVNLMTIIHYWMCFMFIKNILCQVS